MKALIVGSTGLIGRHLTQILLADNDYKEVISIVRRPSGLENKKLNEIQVNYDQLASYEKEMKADHYFCCLGTTIKVAKTKENFYKVDFTYPYETGRIAKKHNAKSFAIVTAIGANAKSSVFYNRTKGEIENALKDLGLNSLSIYRPSLLLGDRDESRLGEKLGEVALGGLSFLMVGPLKNYRAIEGKTVAQVMAQEAKKATSGTHVIESGKIQAIYDKS